MLDVIGRVSRFGKKMERDLKWKRRRETGREFFVRLRLLLSYLRSCRKCFLVRLQCL